MNSILKDFKLEKKVSEEIINKYKNKIPEQVLDIWQNYGFGSFLNGYLKIVNPEEYEDLLKETYISVKDEPIESTTVLFATALGDLIICEKTESKKDNIYLIEYRKGRYKMLLGGLEFFFEDLLDEDYLEDDLEWKPYLEAVNKLGELSYDECFGYVPLLGLGGSEKIENMSKVKIKEHIYLITDFMGPLDKYESAF